MKWFQQLLHGALVGHSEIKNHDKLQSMATRELR